MFDCHIHSFFSGDCDMPAETAVDKAIELGLEGMAFTDHMDLKFPDFSETFEIDFSKYNFFMDQLKESYKGKIKIIKGVEAGIQPHVIEETNKVVQGYDFDFVIASVHIIDGMDPYRRDYFAGKSKQQADLRYLEENLFMVENFKDYDILGHMGYIRRYSNYEDKTLRHSDYTDIIDSILKTIISDGKGIEVNTSGYRSNLGTPMPDYDVVKRYLELGGEIISLGSDAHHPEHIAHSFQTAGKILADMGIKYLVYFEARKPNFYKIT